MTADQLKELKDRLGVLEVSLTSMNDNFRSKKKEQQTLNPNFWDDPKRAEAILKELKSHKAWLASYEK